MRRILLVLCFALLPIDRAICADIPKLLVDNDGNFLKLSLEELATVINTEQIYDQQAAGYSFDDMPSECPKQQTLVFFHLGQVKRFLKQIRTDFYFEQNKDEPDAVQERKKREYLITKRSDIAQRCIALQCFFVSVINKERWKTNPFLKSGAIEDELPNLNLPDSEKNEFARKVLRYLELYHLNTNEELPQVSRTEYAQLEKWYEEHRRKVRDLQKKWWRDALEFDLQRSFLEQQTQSLKEMYQWLTMLYSLGPRADAELLALLKESKYPEKEKVKLLMELGIPYDNYREWESTDGLFKTTAKYISWERDGVTLEKADGKQTTIEFDALRPADQEYVKQQPVPFRTWTSIGGTHTIEAKYFSSTDTIVMLERKDGATLRVVLAEISQKDRDYVSLQQKRETEKKSP